MTTSGRPAGEMEATVEGGSPPEDRTRLRYDLIELLFFAYRDFVGEADAVLADYGFGRAHHRVLHFVDRHPGLPVRDLLKILKITKQSLGRVLRQLVEEGFVEARAGHVDRREKLLFTTDEGAALARRLAGLQTRRIENALAGTDPAAHAEIAGFLASLINEDDRAEAMNRIGIEAPASVSAPPPPRRIARLRR